MNFKSTILVSLLILASAFSYANAADSKQISNSNDEISFLDSDDYDPNASNIEQILNEYDKYYEQETGESPWIGPRKNWSTDWNYTIEQSTCYRETCSVYIHVKKSEQKAYLYINGQLTNTWLVSSGAKGHETPNFDRQPNGRVYNKYSSKTYPGGDYKGLGNMPYAVFISGGFAIHGTPQSNWPMLGKKASHGCIRLHPDNGRYFNELVRHYGVTDTWITVN